MEISALSKDMSRIENYLLRVKAEMLEAAKGCGEGCGDDEEEAEAEAEEEDDEEEAEGDDEEE